VTRDDAAEKVKDRARREPVIIPVLVHLAALAAIALSAVLLIAPAAHHRIGQESEEFLPIASRYLLGATAFLALGMAADCYVIVTKVMESPMSGIIAAVVIAVVCLGLRHLWPWMARKTR
jgi:hypothetical protein